ncbi:hypothetical protein M011DRAFT_475453 [Sporormia fimetaria CBS 119925]|uniref:Uncharacterized protein n=1 Tax=Sporormia fimetaria CBS 119925 TaxID=1340428 RepID=A0A6A6VI16_9PLEO|nr:hypothetical protein M011DRAFT_475453 [Sporormia fimetaria CBS 119925]
MPGGLTKIYRIIVEFITSRLSILNKLFDPTVLRGKTAWPKEKAQQERHGIRFDYDGEVIRKDGKAYHKFNVQPNAGKIPASLRDYRNSDGGNHAVMGSIHLPVNYKGEDKAALFNIQLKRVLVKKDGDDDDIKED